MNNLQSEMKQERQRILDEFNAETARRISEYFGLVPDNKTRKLLYLINFESFRLSRFIEQPPEENGQFIQEWKSMVNRSYNELENNYNKLKADSTFKNLIEARSTEFKNAIELLNNTQIILDKVKAILNSINKEDNQMNNLQSEKKQWDLLDAIEAGVSCHRSYHVEDTPEYRFQNLLFLVNSEAFYLSKLIEQRPIDNKELIKWESMTRMCVDELENNYNKLKADDLYKKLIETNAIEPTDSIQPILDKAKAIL